MATTRRNPLAITTGTTRVARHFSTRGRSIPPMERLQRSSQNRGSGLNVLGAAEHELIGENRMQLAFAARRPFVDRFRYTTFPPAG